MIGMFLGGLIGLRKTAPFTKCLLETIGMRWFLRAGLVVVSASLLASEVSAQEVDPWWGRDKAAHLTVSMGVSSLAYGLVRSRTDRRYLAFGVGLGTSLVVGAAKEGLDSLGLGTPSWRDFFWDSVGAIVGSGLALGLDLILSATVPTETASTRSTASSPERTAP
jgi:uncharacterized protein YfiM (DUF2279 family)